MGGGTSRGRGARATRLPSPEWQAFRATLLQPDRIAYEEIRPVVVLGQEIEARAAEVGVAPRTLARRVEQFAQHSIPGLVATSPREPDDKRLLPQSVHEYILQLKLGYSNAALVGHDWGGVVAWQLATDYPERLSHLVILDAPHQDLMTRAVRRNPVQMFRSWYISIFQLPWVAEHLFFYPFANRGFDDAKPGSFAAEDIVRYREAWAQPGAAHATINWYRAAFRAFLRPAIGAEAHPKGPQLESGTAPIQVRTLILWGEKDRALSPWLARDSAAHCTQSTLRYFPGIGHWLQHDKPQEVTQAILDFLADNSSRGYQAPELPPREKD